MISIDKLVGNLTKKESLKLADSIGTSIKSIIESNGECVISNPRYCVLAHVDGGNGKKFDAYVFCDDEGKLYSCGKINAAENAVAYMRELESEEEGYALTFTFQSSKKTGNRFIKCEIL